MKKIISISTKEFNSRTYSVGQAIASGLSPKDKRAVNREVIDEIVLISTECKTVDLNNIDLRLDLKEFIRVETKPIKYHIMSKGEVLLDVDADFVGTVQYEEDNKVLKIADLSSDPAEYFNTRKIVMRGINAGEYVDEEDFMAYTSSLVAKIDKLDEMLTNIEGHFDIDRHDFLNSNKIGF